jgi:hypothetical protein
MNDTTHEIEAEFRKRIAASTPSERLRMMSGMFSAAKALAGASIGGARDGAAPPRAVLFERMYRTDFSAEEVAAISKRLRTVHAQ